MLKNNISGYCISSGGNRNQNAKMVQSSEGRYSYWDLIKIRGESNTNVNNKVVSIPSRGSNIAWQETPLPSKYFGIWEIFSRTSSRNNVSINSQYIKDGSVNMKIVKSYYNNGVYKIVTTLNNYFQSHFIKDRTGGIGNGGIYINSTNRHAFRSFKEAYDLPVPAKLDGGYK